MELLTRLKKRGNVMYLLDEKTVMELDIIQNRIHCDLRLFLDHCTACGGDWVSMLLSGIEECYPYDYIRLKTECDEINGNSGASEFMHICDFLSTVITDWKNLED